ncbi:MAG: hypothetical protein JKY50_22530 [Oleispira sp.]|nr:hypothetical protein [Oleispira sp.]
MSEKFTVNSDKSKAEFMQAVSDLYDQKKYLTIEVKVGKPRTSPQRKGIEVYCNAMSELLNDAGYDYTGFIAHINDNGVVVPWDQEKFKDAWRLVQAAMYPETVIKGVAKTHKLKADEVTKVYEVVNKKFSEVWGVGMTFPERDK